MEKEKQFILWFDQLTIDDVGLVGGKNASLGEMYRELTHKGVKIPNGFAVTAHAYYYLLEQNGAKEKVREILEDLDTSSMKNLAERGRKVRELIEHIEFPQDLADAIKEAYHNLCKQYGADTDVAVRSSATAEDLPDASFAGQQETYLNIKGEKSIIQACKKCFASLFTNRAISYREDKKFDHFSIGLSIAVQKMVRSDKAASGVMFSIDTESGFKDAVFVTSAYGLGETVVQGSVNPDEFYVFKPTLRQGKKPLISKQKGEKAIKMIYNEGGTKPTKIVNVDKNDQHKFAITQDEVLKLAEWACIIEDHYSGKAGYFKPMDMEWAKDGELGEMFIVQARPETVQSLKNVNVVKEYELQESPKKTLTEGNSVGEKIGTGKAKVIKEVHNINDFKKGEVLITDMTDPDWEPIMKIASAIVTNRGGRTCHAAIISRELGIPCVVGTNTATEDIKSGTPVTVDCTRGNKGFVYEDELKYKVNETDIANMQRPKTKIMMNIGSPDNAFAQSFLPNDGVGLAREEFIINSYIQVHPLALIHFDELKDQSVKAKIKELTDGYASRTEFYVDRLAEGVGKIAAAFYPKDVIVRLSDFKSNEYANLIGGDQFEPDEDNPMIGFRGASRYYSDKFRPAFELECQALKRVREDFGLDNVKIMVPFCRTVEEGEKVLKVMAKNGLKRGENHLEVYVMCEIPSNVLLADQFCDIFDGFSIGSNDLTQLILGVDRDSELVSHIYNERNDAVKHMISEVIKKAKARRKKVGICGQAPSDFPDFAQFLVEEGIDSISLNPDTVMKTTLKILSKEKQLSKK
ncbi:MAG: phosphoenolpyruvate synthase [Candidatus Woesearchaeota archaeon]